MNTAATKKFSQLTIKNPAELCFGRVPKPLTCGFGLQVGAGQVYPEINFTLPTMLIDNTTWGSVVGHYNDIGEMIGRAAKRNHLSGLVVEFELLPPMTENPEWGAEITAVLKKQLKQA